MHPNRPVIVMQVPERLYRADAEAFRNELQALLEVGRPRIVLDCSQIKDIDSRGVEMLLHCMDEAMKRDGDVKLAAVAPGSAVILELMKVDRLFEVFETSDEAVQSFHALPQYEIPQNQTWMAGAADLEAAS
ncbi:MAG TPA: STAS domain-containing protein [Candidatus Sulfotelmatobacter sp.]|nr:STAS domain-containing protein [Candidatus Sulfotelmatobacter sp.]